MKDCTVSQVRVKNLIISCEIPSKPEKSDDPASEAHDISFQI